MGIFDDFEYKENYQDEEKVIEVLKKILRAIHLNNYRDILDCVDGSEVDDVNIINKPTLLEKLHDLIYFRKDNLKEYDIDFLELSLKELKNKKDIPYCYILSENNKVFSIVENELSCEKIIEFQNENSFEME